MRRVLRHQYDREQLGLVAIGRVSYHPPSLGRLQRVSWRKRRCYRPIRRMNLRVLTMAM